MSSSFSMKSIDNIVDSALAEHLRLSNEVTVLKSQLSDASRICISALQNGSKLLICGNGGSAADAQHIASELVGRFTADRPPIAAISLSSDTSILTSVANDFSFSTVFLRQILALGQAGDVLLTISTSGNSQNCILAAEEAKSMSLRTIAFLGKDGGKLKDIVDLPLIVPSDSTARIQEMHILFAHIICLSIESSLFPV